MNVMPAARASRLLADSAKPRSLESRARHSRCCRRPATVARESAPAHWMQTAYRYFLIEPYWLAPGCQFSAACGTGWLLRHWPFCHAGRPRDRTSALQIVLTGASETRGDSPVVLRFGDLVRARRWADEVHRCSADLATKYRVTLPVGRATSPGGGSDHV